MSVGAVPSVWKQAVITPVFKKGPAADPSNYRPISQTSVFSKLMERVICADLTPYLISHGFINENQYGFVSKRSTLTNLLESVDDWSLILEVKHSNAVVYVDFHRAFDTITFPKLLYKLQAYGITGSLLDLISNFLTGRSHCTRVGKSFSDNAELISGVVQGSVLGPLLFLLYINDIFSIIKYPVTGKLYADDLKIYTNTSTDNLTALQECLNAIHEWASVWQLTISFNKCQSLCVGRFNSVNSLCHIDNRCLAVSQLVSDLGVLVDSDLKFSAHVDKVVSRASRISSLVFKCFLSKDQTNLVTAFKVYIRPILEYCSPVWSPRLLKDIRRIESVQRRFTKRIPHLENVKYVDRLQILGLERLDVRRLKADLVLTYKILFGHVDLDFDKYFTLATYCSTRGHSYKLFVKRCHSSVRMHFFANRVIRVWNDLPITIDFSSISRFKYSLRSIDLAKYCV